MFKPTRSLQSTCEPAGEETTAQSGHPEPNVSPKREWRTTISTSDEGTQTHCFKWHSGYRIHGQGIETLWSCQLISTGSHLRKRWPTH
jgi:hypothetical protein